MLFPPIKHFISITWFTCRPQIVLFLALTLNKSTPSSLQCHMHLLMTQTSSAEVEVHHKNGEEKHG